MVTNLFHLDNMTSLLQKITIPVSHVLIFSELPFWQWNEVAREAEISALDIARI